MPIRTIVFIFTFFFSSLCFAIDLGLSGSGKDVAFDIRSTNPNASGWGGYGRLIVDFEEYVITVPESNCF
ncbi:MAG: hypothetical protein RRB22_12135 [Gammaproteobacteria bacterium]|nr:hypothetical protein [Gammaproteobacteria bacterium]